MKEKDKGEMMRAMIAMIACAATPHHGAGSRRRDCTGGTSFAGKPGWRSCRLRADDGLRLGRL